MGDPDLTRLVNAWHRHPPQGATKKMSTIVEILSTLLGRITIIVTKLSQNNFILTRGTRDSKIVKNVGYNPQDLRVLREIA